MLELLEVLEGLITLPGNGAASGQMTTTRRVRKEGLFSVDSALLHCSACGGL